MEAFSEDDKKEIKRRILLVCTASQFNERVKVYAQAFNNSVGSNWKFIVVVMSPVALIVAVVFLIFLLILAVVFIVVMIGKAIFIFKETCWNARTVPYKRLV